MRNAIKMKRLIPVIGSGVTKETRTKFGIVPNAEQLKKEMIDIIVKYDLGADKKELLQENLKFIAGVLKSIFEKPNERCQDEFVQYVERSFMGVHDVDQHLVCFLKSGWDYIYTLNYDDTIEKCLPEYDVFIPYRNLSDKVREKPHIIKLHGNARDFVKERNFKYLILSDEDYLDAIASEKNRVMAKWLSMDCTSKDFIFLGCSLDSEFDILYANRRNMKCSGKECSSFYIMLVDNYDTNTAKIDYKRNKILEKYNIKYVLKVAKRDMHQLYLEITKMSKDINSVNTDDEFDRYANPNIRQLDYDDKDKGNNLNYYYFFSNQRVFTDEKEIVLPAYFVKRDAVHQIKENIKNNISVNILHGTSFSGKTYALIELAKDLRGSYQVYFFRDKIISPSALESLFKQKDIIVLFDVNTLENDNFNKFCVENIAHLKQQNIKVVVAVNVSDKDFEKLNDRTNHDLSYVFINNRLSDREYEAFCKHSKRLNIIPRRKRDTFLDYALRVELLMINRSFINDMPDTNIIPVERNKELLKCMILLANNSFITADMVAEFDIMHELSVLCSKYNIAVQKSYFIGIEKQKGSHSTYKYVLNSAYWVYRCLSRYTSSNNSYGSIVDAIVDIIHTYNDKKLRRSALNRYIKPYYYLDRIQEMFFSDAGDKGWLKLPEQLYGELIRGVLADDFHVLHQSAKCSLRKFDNETSNDERKSILQDAQFSIERAIECAERVSFDNSYTLAHMRVTKMLICINIYNLLLGVSTDNYDKVLRAIDAVYDVFVVNERFLIDFLQEIKQDRRDRRGVVAQFLKDILLGKFEMNHYNTAKINDIIKSAQKSEILK